MAKLGDIVTNLTVDKRSFEAGIKDATKSTRRFGGSLERELRAAQKEVKRLSEEYVSGGKVTRDQLKLAVQGVDRLKARIDAAKVAVKSLSGEMGDLPELARGPMQGPMPLDLHALAMQERAERMSLQGAGGAAPLMGMGRGGMGGGGRRVNVTHALLELSRGAEDAAVSFGTTGLAGAIRGSANNMAAFATIINPMAGVVVGLGAALAAVLIPRLMEMKSAADIAREAIGTLDEAIAKATERREANERLAGLRSGAGSIEDQRGRVTSAQNELSDVDSTLWSLRVGRDAAVRAGDDSAVSVFDERIAEATQRRQEVASRLQTERRFLREGVASQSLRDRRSRQFDEWRMSNIGREDFRNLQRDERRARIQAERDRESQFETVDSELMQRGLVAGLMSRLTSLQQQRGRFEQPSMQSRDLPGVATRGNSIDRIIEIAQAKREAKEESYRKSNIEKLDKQIELLEKLIGEVRDVDTGLVPAGLN